MNKITNVVKVLEFATDTQMLKNVESNLDRKELISFLKSLGLGARMKGVSYIVDILCYCYANNVYEIVTLGAFYALFSKCSYNFDEKQTKNMKWNIEDSIDYLEKSPTRNDELLCSIFDEFKYYDELTPKTFLNDLLMYIHSNENNFIKK